MVETVINLKCERGKNSTPLGHHRKYKQMHDSFSFALEILNNPKRNLHSMSEA